MTRFHLALSLLVIAGLLGLSEPAVAQYSYDLSDEPAPEDTLKESETVDVLAEPAKDPTELVVERAITWTRRMLFRGFPDFSTTGTWAAYQETDWRKAAGSFGPVKARVIFNYLGATSWLGEPAEWMQVVYRTLDTLRITVELDLLVSGGEKIEKIHRALYRIGKGDLAGADFTVPEDKLDYDRVDVPKAGEQTQLRMYSGTYEATIFEGTGTDAAKVYAYRASGLPPLGLAVLGYGDEALTISSSGGDAEPRFDAPSPTIR